MSHKLETKFDLEQDKKIQRDQVYPTFVMINCEPEKEGRVIEKLSTLKSVKEIHQTHGKYDILVKLENMTGTELKEMIDREILVMNAVQSITNLSASSVA